MDKVYKNLIFCISEQLVDVSDMKQWVFHKIGNIFFTYGNDDLFSQQTLCSHLDVWFGFRVTFDYIVDLIDFFCIDWRKCFLDLDDLRYTNVLLWSLSIWFRCWFGFVIQFPTIEILQDSIDFLLRFHRDRWRNTFYLH